MSQPKLFQKAAVEAALLCFDRPGPQRFLVADEVGLGKTVVAREISRELARRKAKRKRQLVIYYIANGHSVSQQNKARIVDFLADAHRKLATNTPDRLSLMAAAPRSSAPVVIYALTPHTSFPGVRTRLTGGRKPERALLHALLERTHPTFLEDRGSDFLQLAARSNWEGELDLARKTLDDSCIPRGLVNRFRDSLAKEFGKPLKACLDKAAEASRTSFVGRLRRALALATLADQPPDLVILDEFQRYRYLIESEATDPLVRALLRGGRGRRRPALLMLSATPYRLLATRWEEARGILAQRELLDLIRFLSDDPTREQAGKLFMAFGDKLRDIVGHADLTTAEAAAELAAGVRLRDALRALLSPYISRTERDAVATADLAVHAPPPLAAILKPEDARMFSHLCDSLVEHRRSDALPYWSSVPFPAQSLGAGYAAWRRDRIVDDPTLPRMTRRICDTLQPPGEWPDAKMRALARIAPPEDLALPWIAPSLPWWTLDRSWRAAADPKLLMFSRFRVTPPSVAALLSFSVEARFLAGSTDGYAKAYSRRRFKFSRTPGPAMAAFHPCPWLVRNTDPLAAAGGSLETARARVIDQILAALPDEFPIFRKGRRARRLRPPGRLVAELEARFGLAKASADAWLGVAGDDAAALNSVRVWRNASPLESLSLAELETLADHAMGAPGVVLARALGRHDPTAPSPKRLPEMVSLSWQALRPYLDDPVKLARVGDGSIEAVLKAVVEGGLESTLDEHFWSRKPTLPGGAAELAGDLSGMLRLGAGGFNFHTIAERPVGTVRVRCHAALPFGEAKMAGSDTPGASARPARPDEIRRAFNSPFWPQVLTTTSVGQEGLDFHPWCSRVLHWDFSSNPLDLEQREGRIQRYAGLAIRRRLARDLRRRSLARASRSRASPWDILEQVANNLHPRDSGLRPWWVLEGAEITRHVFERPFGRDIARYQALRELRLIFRLALGQPNQEDFLSILAKGGHAHRDALQPLVLDLSALGLRELTRGRAAKVLEAT